MSTEWVVHPNRSALGTDEPGRNGHYRPDKPRRRPPAVSTANKCVARVKLPRKLSDLADPDGTVTFGGYDWFFVAGAAHTFARVHTDTEIPPPFGFKTRGKWWWWDGTTTDDSILDGPDAIAYIEEYFALLFPGLATTVTDNR
ncbi:hypothetical protein [Mycolicibacterium fortuitum]|uniref:hypothetical protein n=1 Tax=Mycolicibacterium fortuitum TaxID=1766 RepID=UPI003AB08309